jgi:uncharacterized protein YjcR
MRSENIEQQVERDFGMDFLSFSKKCKGQGLELHEVAEMLGCSVSNLRRIMRKYGFSFFVPEATPMLKTCVNFQNKKINLVNCLSRRWVA